MQKPVILTLVSILTGSLPTGSPALRTASSEVRELAYPVLDPRSFEIAPFLAPSRLEVDAQGRLVECTSANLASCSIGGRRLGTELTARRAEKVEGVFAIGSGEVVFAGDGMEGFGRTVVVAHRHGRRWLHSMYADLDAIEVRPGDVVAPTTRIGTIGGSGRERARLLFRVAFDRGADVCGATLGAGLLHCLGPGFVTTDDLAAALDHFTDPLLLVELFNRPPSERWPVAPQSPAPAAGAAARALPRCAGVGGAAGSCLDWADAEGAVFYDVFLDDALVGRVADSHWFPDRRIEPEVDYRWHVVARNFFGETVGPAWSLRLLPEESGVADGEAPGGIRERGNPAGQVRGSPPAGSRPTNRGTATGGGRGAAGETRRHPFRTRLYDGQLERVSISEPLAIGAPLALSTPVASSAAPGTEHTAETVEIVFTESVRELAQSLNYDPLTILNWMRSNIVYTPYFGSKKGADATLLQREGNDWDQASLLAALLRVGDENGDFKTPTRYRHGEIKLDLNVAMRLVGANDPIVAAEILAATEVPVRLYVDAATGSPLFLTLEHSWIEGYVTYDYRRGAVQTAAPEDKAWIPLLPVSPRSLVAHDIDVVAEMVGAGAFDSVTFYRDYLGGAYPAQTPLEAFEGVVADYLQIEHPGTALEDVTSRSFYLDALLEFLPGTTPFEVVADFGASASVPAALRQEIRLTLEDAASSTQLLDHTIPMASVADQEAALVYVGATASDQATIDSFGSIYAVEPLSAVDLKPIFDVRGLPLAGGAAGDPAIMAGAKVDLTMRFLAPTRESPGGPVTTEEVDVIEKTFRAGNSIAIATNSGRVIPDESRPADDTSSSELVAVQKLYATARDYLRRDQDSQDRLAALMGGEFHHIATRAFVFNGLEMTWQGGLPYSFTWKGLRIDSSALVDYYHRFDDRGEQQVEFTHVFGLQASLDESRVFEEEFDIEAMSTVKGLRMINQGQIPGTAMVMVDSSNEGVIDTLALSSGLRAKLHELVQEGDTLYVPTQPFTYMQWTGLVYIHVDHATGSGGYIIGEGLNGAHTVELWESGWEHFWRSLGLALGGTVTIYTPAEGQIFTVGDIVTWQAIYTPPAPFQPWFEQKLLRVTRPGAQVLRAGYGTGVTRTIDVRRRPELGEAPVPTDSGDVDLDELIIAAGVEHDIPPALLKALFVQESGPQLDPQAYRYEPCRDLDTVQENFFVGTLLDKEPYVDFTVEGVSSTGAAVPEGDRVAALTGSPEQIASTSSLEVEEGDSAFSVWDKNDDVHNYSDFGCELDEESGDFTAQLLIAASYGLGQTMYYVAIERGFPHSSLVTDLFDPEVAIDLAASHLRLQYDQQGGTGDECNMGGTNWWNALRDYNNSTAYAGEVCAKYNSGQYDPTDP